MNFDMFTADISGVLAGDTLNLKTFRDGIRMTETVLYKTDASWSWPSLSKIMFLTRTTLLYKWRRFVYFHINLAWSLNWFSIDHNIIHLIVYERQLYIIFLFITVWWTCGKQKTKWATLYIVPYTIHSNIKQSWE